MFINTLLKLRTSKPYPGDINIPSYLGGKKKSPITLISSYPSPTNPHLIKLADNVHVRI